MPSADRKNILTILEKRLNQVSYEDFSEKSLRDRNEILTQISRVLLEPERRRIYEEYYVKESLEESEKSWDVPQGSEVGGLILLLEAGQAEETIRIGNMIYSKWKSNIGVNASAFQDLMLLIDHASIELAKQLSTKRHYKSSAEVIKRRIRRVDNKQLEVMQEKLKSAFDELKPYYILDLISRNSSEREHAQGIEELKELVKERGGLEASSNKYMSNDEFKAFIRQLRKFLNVQEQVDLFRHWSMEGSDAGSFLTGIALVAAGFAQRKPERLVHALQLLNEIKTQDLETLKANIYLLLGDIEKADSLLSEFGDDDLVAWCMENGRSRLAQQCEWCKEWLERDVLCGYRDLEVEPDLEAYFSDRDVVTYIEKSDLGLNHEDMDRVLSTNEIGGSVEVESEQTVGNRFRGINQRISNVSKRMQDSRMSMRTKQIALGLTMLTILTLFLYLLAKQTSKETEKATHSKMLRDKDIQRSDAIEGLVSKKGENATVSKESLIRLFDDWFTIKRITLSGSALPLTARNIATDNAVKKLISERESDKRKGEIQNIVVNIRDLRIITKSEGRVEVELILNYHDQRLDRNGQLIEATPEHDFVRKYTVISNKGRWLVD